MLRYLLNPKKYSFLILGVLSAMTFTACSTSQTASTGDGIYDDSGVTPQRQVKVTDTESAAIYRNYFEAEAKKYEFDEDDVITDVDAYEGYPQNAEGNVYAETDYGAGAPPWEYNTDVSISFNFGYGLGGFWGYDPFWGWGNPYYAWGLGYPYYGWAWGYPYYSWSYPYYSWGYPYYGWGYPGWGYPGWGYPGYHPPHYPGYDYTYGRRSTYNTNRPWARNNTRNGYQRTSTTGRRGVASTNIYRKAVRDRSAVVADRNTNRRYNRNSSSGQYNKSIRNSTRSSNNRYNNRATTRPATRRSTPTYNRGSLGSPSRGNVTRGRHQASTYDFKEGPVYAYSRGNTKGITRLPNRNNVNRSATRVSATTRSSNATRRITGSTTSQYRKVATTRNSGYRTNNVSAVPKRNYRSNSYGTNTGSRSSSNRSYRPSKSSGYKSTPARSYSRSSGTRSASPASTRSSGSSSRSSGRSVSRGSSRR